MSMGGETYLLSAMGDLRKAASGYRDADLGDRIVVAEGLDVQHVGDLQRERLQRPAEIALRDAVDAVAELPEVPDPVDHAVMRPEDRIECRCRDAPHVAELGRLVRVPA